MAKPAHETPHLQAALWETQLIDLACHGHIALDGTEEDLNGLIRTCAHQAGIEDLSIQEGGNLLDTIDKILSPKAPEGIDLVICGTGIQGMTGIGFLREVRRESPDPQDPHVILVADDGEDALEAIRLGVDGYLVAPVDPGRLAGLLAKVFREITGSQDDLRWIRSREGFRRIRLSRLAYATTVDHDQELHLTDGSCLATRLSSQALFDLLEGDRRFFKVGSSFIVNLDLVERVDAGASQAILRDGTSIPVPMRVRKPLEEAILAEG